METEGDVGRERELQLEIIEGGLARGTQAGSAKLALERETEKGPGKCSEVFSESIEVEVAGDNNTEPETSPIKEEVLEDEVRGIKQIVAEVVGFVTLFDLEEKWRR